MSDYEWPRNVQIMHSLFENGPESVSDEDLLFVLEERYQKVPPPGPCPVCGDKRTIGATGPEGISWTCSPKMDNPDDPDGPMIYKPGRGPDQESWNSDMEHYKRSLFTQHRSGDEFVMEAARRLRERMS